MAQFTFEAIGTHWTLDILDQVSETDLAELLKVIHERIEQFDVTYSRFRNDSLITKMSQTSGVYTLPEDALPLFDLYSKLYGLSAGKFTPLIGNTLEQAGYDANYSLESSSEVSKPKSWEEVMKLDYPRLEIIEPCMIDLGAAGKGYLVDLVSELIASHGIKNFCVDAGGDIVQRSLAGEVLEVALENPNDTSQAIGVARISNQSLCGSAGNRRKWGEYTHIINPETLKSSENIAAVWVVAKTGLVADGLTTALYFDDPQIFESDFSFEYLIMYTDSSIAKSAGFPADLFYL